MNSIFKIGTETIPVAGLLAIQAGKSHFSYCLTDRTGNELYQLNYFSIKEWNDDTIKNLLVELPPITTDIQKVEFAFETEEFTLFPVAGFQEDKLYAAHNALHPFTENCVFRKDSLAEWQLYIGYCLPSLLMNALLNRYPEVRVRHFLKLILQQAGQSGMQGKLVVSIRPNYFFAVLLRNNRLQFAKQFYYETPADILYYFLKMCEDQLITPHEVRVELTGLVDQDSALYRELGQYFAQLEFRNANWKTEDSSFPSHYFTQLNDLAQCAL